MPYARLYITAIVVGLYLILRYSFIGTSFDLWVRALASNAQVGLFEIFSMRFRKIDPKMIVYGRIRTTKAGLDISAKDLASHHLAGGRMPNVVNAMIAARAAGQELTWAEATAIDLTGRDVLAEVVAKQETQSQQQG